MVVSANLLLAFFSPLMEVFMVSNCSKMAWVLARLAIVTSDGLVLVRSPVGAPWWSDVWEAWLGDVSNLTS